MYHKNFNRIIAIIGVLATLFSFTACSFAEDISKSAEILNNNQTIENQTNDNYDPITTVEEEVISTENLETSTVDFLSIDSTSYKKVNLDHCYNALQTDNQKTLYTEIENSVNIISSEKNENGKYLIQPIELTGIILEQEEIMLVLEAFTNDTPEVFWLDNYLTYYDNGYTMTVQFYSHLSDKEIKTYSEKIENNVNQMLSTLPEDLSEFERELYLHDELLSNCTYDYDAVEDTDIWTAYNIYGAFANGLAVCEGYSKSMQLLLKYAGIESVLANGRYDDSWHQWNVVNIDDEWYHLDSTWNDSDDQIFYNYFNVDTAQIKTDRTISEDYYSLTAQQINGSSSKQSILFNISVPNCNSDKDNFYVKNSVLFHNFDNDNASEIEKELFEAVNNNENCIYIKIGNNLDYKYTTNALFFNEPYKFFEYANNVNNQLGSINIDLDDISIIQREDLRIIEVYFKFY